MSTEVLTNVRDDHGMKARLTLNKEDRYQELLEFAHSCPCVMEWSLEYLFRLGIYRNFFFTFVDLLLVCDHLLIQPVMIGVQS